MLRTFVAIELPDGVLAALEEVQAALSARAARAGVGRGLKWVGASGIHLTLKFLGPTGASLVPEIERRLATGLAGQRSLSLGLAGLGVFPSSRAPRVLWVGLAGDLVGLGEIQRLVEGAIAPLGYPTESRPFSPHRTLARVGDAVGPADRQVLGELVRAFDRPPSASFVAAEVSLMRSELSPAGARYSRLFGVPLLPGPG